MKLVLHPAVDSARLERLREVAGEVSLCNCDTLKQAQGEMPSASAFFGKLTPELLAAAGELDWVQSPTASLEHYLFPELIEHPCTLTNMRGLFGDVIAEHVVGQMLCIVRNLHIYLRQQLQHRWAPIGGESTRASNATGPGAVSPIDLAHRTLAGCRLGIVGVGAIGSEIARKARLLGMTVCGVDPLVRSVPDVIDEVWPTKERPRLLAESDFVVIAAPHTPRTEKLFRAEQFQLMQSTAWLINIGRGVIVDLHDLTIALEQGDIAGAALDVFEQEPLPPEHPLWEMENVLITPHIAAASPLIPQRHLETLVENVRRYAHGEPLLNVVNKREWY
ncbi:MAG: D-2-hydroxyacid dehydrogenase [Planctomycetaceae bacterium]|nr:D-2-hydroxyacid dehydrogenase [Planctomycetaceae bacterium]